MNFIDTNIFIYAHDTSDPAKTRQARELLVKLVDNHEGCISTQVIQEFCNVSLSKSVIPLKPTDVRNILSNLLEPLLAHRPDIEFYNRTLKTFERYSLSFYDAMIVQAAIDLRCKVLYSEDMQANAIYGGVRIVNPFV